MTLTTRVAAPRRAAGVQLLGEMAGSGYRHPPALVRRADGQTITLTPLLHQTLRAVDGERAYEEIAAVVSATVGRTATATDVAYLVEQKLRPLGLVRTGEDPEPTTRRANPLLALRLKVMVTNPRLTQRLTAPFALLFRPWIALPLLMVFALVSWWMLVDKGLASAAHQAFYEPGMLLTVWALVVVSAGFHEFGHAAACRYGGATPGVMGAGLYLVWPAFYTDVTDSYRLGKGGRLRVDLGGLYFNALFALATTAAWVVTRSDALLLVVAAQHLQMLRQLAPFIRADGYHIVADLTGVPDLFAHIKPTLLGLLPSRWVGRQRSVLRPWARFVVSAWVLTVVPLLLTLLAGAVYLLPRLAATAWDSMGQQWAGAETSWAAGDLAGSVARGLSVAIVALPVLGILYLLARVVRRTGGRVWAMTEDRLGARALAVMTGLIVAALVAWTWWPSDQYRPIRADEGGRITQLVDTVGGPYPVEPAVPAAPWNTMAVAAQVPAPVPVAQEPVLPGPAPTFAVIQSSSSSTEKGTAAPEQPAVVVAEVPDEGTWVFPFPALPAPAEGDNRAESVNTTDGTFAAAMSVALAIVTGEEDVDQRNEAFAFASCTDCITTAVAFQVLLIIGQADVVTPVNTAMAVNYDCVRCRTAAIASQLVVTLTRMPSDEAQQKVAAALTRLEAIEPHLQSMTVADIYAVLTSTKAEILKALEEDGAVPEVLTDLAEAVATAEATAAPSSTSTPTTTSTATSTPSGSADPASPSVGTASDSPTASPTSEESPSAASSPSETEPSPSDEPTPSETATEPSNEPSPSDEATPTDEATPSGTAEPTATP